MELNNLKQLYVHELEDLYSAENQIVDALPKMADATRDSRLKSAFHQHLELTKKQKGRLENIFSQLGHKPDKSKCEGMRGIIKEGESFIKKDKSFFRGDVDDYVLDAALIAPLKGWSIMRFRVMGRRAHMLNGSVFRSKRNSCSKRWKKKCVRIMN